VERLTPSDSAASRGDRAIGVFMGVSFPSTFLMDFLLSDEDTPFDICSAWSTVSHKGLTHVNRYRTSIGNPGHRKTLTNIDVRLCPEIRQKLDFFRKIKEPIATASKKYLPKLPETLN